MRFLNKIITVLFTLLLIVGCGQKETEVDNKTYEYITPTTLYAFDLLESKIKEKIYFSNTGEVLEDYKIQMIGSKLPEIILEDFYGRSINLGDYLDKNLVIEVVQHNCEHCKLQEREHTDIIKSNNKDLDFIQYFAFGDNTQVGSFYLSIEKTISKEDIVIPENKEFTKYVLDIGTQFTPSYFLYKNGVLSFVLDGEVDPGRFNRALDLAFNEGLDKSKLVSENGEYVLDIKRNQDDIINDMSKENLDKLYTLIRDEDDFSPSMTLDLIGQPVNFKNLEMGNGYSEVEDWSVYENENLILVYMYYGQNDDSNIGVLELIKDLVKKYPEYKFVTLVVDGDKLSIKKLQNYKININCPMISDTANMPKSFEMFEVNMFPSAFFIEKGTVTGALSSLTEASIFKKAVGMFMGDNSIAHKDNN